MTAPTPGGSGVYYNPNAKPNGAVTPQQQKSGYIPVLSDGKPNFGALDQPSPTGGLTQWDIPTDLTKMLALSAGKLWFDTGTHKTVANAYTPGAQTDSQVAEHTVKLVDINHYNIMRKPEQVMAQFAAMSMNDPAKFMAFQKLLASGPWGSVHLNGSWDSDTESALGHAMLQYAKLSMGTGVAMSFSDYLFQTAQRAQALGGDGTSLGHSGGSGISTSHIAVTDPDTIKAQAQQAATDALGHKLSEGELNAFVTQFQAAQKSYQTATSGVVSSPDLGTEAEKFVQTNNPQDFQKNNQQAYFNLLVNMMTSGGPQRPDQAPVAPVT